jgi:predicted Zn-ribbon and HTH transcriptional regulator
MPTSDRKVQSELVSAMQPMDKSTTPPKNPANCPSCRSGVIEVPPAIMADVVHVEL